MEMRVGLSGEIERHLLVEREEFVCVLEKVTKPALCRPEPLHRCAPRARYPSIGVIIGLLHIHQDIAKLQPKQDIFHRSLTYSGRKRAWSPAFTHCCE